MLVIERQPGERVRIELPDGRFVWLTAVRMDRGRMRIGIHAPPDCVILREELIPKAPEKK